MRLEDGNKKYNQLLEENGYEIIFFIKDDFNYDGSD